MWTMTPVSTIAVTTIAGIVVANTASTIAIMTTITTVAPMATMWCTYTGTNTQSGNKQQTKNLKAKTMIA